ncbi:hypothetical protein TYRP_009915 [Tyrophagus putrescentiae]|nr:hypothetical protein TYRP_009915 [Tyrophagus putrescentiae]
MSSRTKHKEKDSEEDSGAIEPAPAPAPELCLAAPTMEACTCSWNHCSTCRSWLSVSAATRCETWARKLSSRSREAEGTISRRYRCDSPPGLEGATTTG